MAWTNHQKGIVKRYQALARLPDFDYRALLQAVTGQASSTAKKLTQDDFDQTMARLEAVLWERFGQGECDRPPAELTHHYWQDRCPPLGLINSRQEALIQSLLGQLAPSLPATFDPERWLLGTASKAAGAPVGALRQLTEAEAGRLIEALKDRLRQRGVATQQEGWTEGPTRRPLPATLDP
jgi:hypothetical protein